jgi:hypothetical protein
MPSFDVNRLIQRLDNRRVVFWGDSVMRQTFDNFACFFESAGKCCRILIYFVLTFNYIKVINR